MMRVLLPFLFLGLLACGDIPSDAIPVTMPNDPVSGIYRTDASGNTLGTYGSPSQGGHAGGLRIRCAPGTEPDPSEGHMNVPQTITLSSPYPNPIYGTLFTLRYTIACRTDVTIEVVEATPSPWILASMPMNALISVGQGRTVWRLKRTDLVPGTHATNIGMHDVGPSLLPDIRVRLNGFFRIYFVAGEFKAWRDVALFQDPCLAPVGLRGGYSCD